MNSTATRRYVSGAGELVQYWDSSDGKSPLGGSKSLLYKKRSKSSSFCRDDNDETFIVDLLFKAILAFLVLTSIVYVTRQAGTKISTRASRRGLNHLHPTIQEQPIMAPPAAPTMDHHLHEQIHHHHRISAPRPIPADTFNAYRAALLGSEAVRNQFVNLPAEVVSSLSAQEVQEVASRLEETNGSVDIYTIISKVLNQEAR